MAQEDPDEVLARIRIGLEGSRLIQRGLRSCPRHHGAELTRRCDAPCRPTQLSLDGLHSLPPSGVLSLGSNGQFKPLRVGADTCRDRFRWQPGHWQGQLEYIPAVAMEVHHVATHKPCQGAGDAQADADRISLT